MAGWSTLRIIKRTNKWTSLLAVTMHIASICVDYCCTKVKRNQSSTVLVQLNKGKLLTKCMTGRAPLPDTVRLGLDTADNYLVFSLTVNLSLVGDNWFSITLMAGHTQAPLRG